MKIRVSVAWLALFLAIAAFFFPPPARSQAYFPCLPTTRAHLEERYDEQVLGAGIAARQALVQLVANLETGSWTVIVTFSNGRTCALASGQSWTVVEPAPPSDPS